MKKVKFLKLMRLLLIFLFALSVNYVKGQSLILSDSLSKNYPISVFKNIHIKGSLSIGEETKNEFSKNKFIIFNRDVTEVIKISQSGEFLYTPKYFCECKKCKKFKGMKKLNIK